MPFPALAAALAAAALLAAAVAAALATALATARAAAALAVATMRATQPACHPTGPPLSAIASCQPPRAAGAPTTSNGNGWRRPHVRGRRWGLLRGAR